MAMLAIPSFVIHSIMRRSLMGGLATDPVLTERRRPSRRSLCARLAPDRARVARTPATASQSS
jgi:hypothetical protein